MNPGQDIRVVDFVAKARDLSSKLDGGLRLARHIADTFDSDLADVIEHAAASASALVNALPSSLPVTDSFAGEPAHYLTIRALEASQAVEDALARARCLAPGTSQRVVNPSAAATFLIRADDLVRNLAQVSALAHEVVDLVEVARVQSIERSLAEQSVPLSKSREGSQAPRIAPSAGRLAAAAAWLLPARDRTRFHEEYRSELWDLATAGAARRQQICYALRQLRCAVPLRFTVLSPRRRKASP